MQLIISRQGKITEYMPRDSLPFFWLEESWGWDFPYGSNVGEFLSLRGEAEKHQIKLLETWLCESNPEVDTW